MAGIAPGRAPRATPGPWTRENRFFTDCTLIFGDVYRFCRFLESPFSAGSRPIFAIKYSFCSIFRDLQNYLAKFSKLFKILHRISDFRKKSAYFLQKSGNFFKKFQKLADFCKMLQKFQEIS